MKIFRNLTQPIFIGLALTSNLAFASDNFQEGDLALAFYQVISGVVQENTYVVNLGQASLYRENTQNNVSLSTVNPNLVSSNIDADLDQTFGTNWADGGTVYWMLVGGVSSGGAQSPFFPGTQPTSGDPIRTNYFSKSRATLNSNSVSPGTSVNRFLSSTNRAIFSNNIISFLKGCSYGIDGFETSTSTSGINAAAAILPKSNVNTVDQFLPPAKLTSFGVGSDHNPQQLLRSGPIAGTAGVEGALDLYRIINLTEGADLTAAASASNAEPGIAQFIGTLTLAGNGDLKITSIPSASTVENYSSWAATNNVTGGINGDSDNDGIANSMEYAIVSNLAGSDGSLGTFNDGILSFAKRPEAVTNGDVTYEIEESDDLGISDAWQVVTPAFNTTSIISYLLPSGSPKKFARLKITVAP